MTLGPAGRGKSITGRVNAKAALGRAKGRKALRWLRQSAPNLAGFQAAEAFMAFAAAFSAALEAVGAAVSRASK